MRTAYEQRRITDEGLTVIAQAVQICALYARQGLTPILRQIYYQFIARDLFPESWRNEQGTKNNLRNYKKLCKLLSDGRISGLIDWDHIEDRTRRPAGGDYGFRDPDHRVRTVPDGYAITRWNGQDHRIEVWVEKESLAAIVARPCDRWNVRSLACKGSPSTSMVYDASQRIIAYEQRDLKVIVYYLGDHDPTGLDIDRDVQARLELFGCQAEVRRIALTMDQVDALNPPPSPVKLTDSRTSGYVERFGTTECWELDALDPDALDTLIENAITSGLDMSLWRARERQEARDLVELQALADNWASVRRFLTDEGLLDYAAADQADSDAAEDEDEDENGF